MTSRRKFVFGALSVPIAVRTPLSAAAADLFAIEPWYALNYPSFDSLDAPQPFGYKEPPPEAKAKAENIIKETVKGPKPIDVAQSFVDRFYASDPEALSQWPEPAAWNPLIVTFFRATSTKANNDMVPWCAAFANWCIERAGRTSSRSAGSQSFLRKEFKATSTPNVGDLAIFTCYDKDTNKSIGLGHVGFVREKPKGLEVKLIGGNQSADGRSSIICERIFATGNREVKRKKDGVYVSCVMRLNTYIAIV